MVPSQRTVDCLSQTARELYGYSVAYLSGNLPGVALEDISVSESLKSGGLAKGNRTVVLGMGEATPGNVCTSGCQSRGNIVPSHTPIYIRVAIVPLVALKLKMVW